MALRGTLLVAGPGLADPNFRRTVVLVGEHGPEGSMGVVLNRPSAVTVDEAVPPLATLPGDRLVHVGGPVQPQAIVVLGDFGDTTQAGMLVFDTVGFLPGEIDDVSEVASVRRARIFAGYAGWAAGQLEAELEEGSWILEHPVPDDVFTPTPERLWSDVLRRKGGPYAVLALMPDDPRVN